MTPLSDRFTAHVRRRRLLEPGTTAVVAVSGGLDSVVLLHLLRFHGPVDGLRLIVGHVDHGMRPGSRADAAWVRGLARAWAVEARISRLSRAPTSEAEAREARYGALSGMMDEEDGDALLTAHHADDQAETVLFRAARGTGIRGLGGMAARGPGRRVRLLLPFWRDELEAYARATSLSWRTDPTNLDRAFARNVIRHDVLPRLEADVSPGARRALVRLARHARSEEAAWRSLLPDLLGHVVEEASPDRIVVARDALLSYHSAVRARLVRALVRRFGTVLDEAGTRAAVEFTRAGSSGGYRELPGGLILRRSFDRLLLERAGGDAPPAGAGPVAGAEPPGSTVEITSAAEGEAEIRLGERVYRVTWGPGPPEGAHGETLSLAGPSFPLRVRTWAPGDRMRLSYGSKKLAKLFAEARVPAHERRLVPVLVDARDRVLWAPGVARAEMDESTTDPILTVSIDHADD